MISDSQIQELYDKQKLHENLMLYCRGIDRQDIELIRSTYWPDSTDDHGGYVGPGQDWADVSSSWRLKVHNINHHVSNVLIELKANQAERESMFLNVVTWKEPHITVFLGGRYRDLCEKRDGEWRILNRVCVWDWFESQETTGGYELCDIPEVTNWGAFYPEDPIYTNWDRSSPTKFPRPIASYFASLGQHVSKQREE